MTDEFPQNDPEPVLVDDVEPEDVEQAPEPPSDDVDDVEPETFTREYVTELRDEAKAHRLRARDAEHERDRLREQLWVARVAALDVLADPSDLPLDVDALDDPGALERAARDLVARKPHMAKRVARGDIGQHAPATDDGFSLVGALRAAGSM